MAEEKVPDDKDGVVCFLFCDQKKQIHREGKPLFPPLPTTEKMEKHQDLWSGQWKKSKGGQGEMVRKV